MTRKPSLTGEALRLSLIAQAAEYSAKRNPDSSMQAVADRARRLSEKAQKFATKAMKEGKAGLVTDGESVAIVER